MKTFANTILAVMAISASGCNTVAARAGAHEGRVIEFKSGPSGFDTRTFFYEAEHEVVAFDSQFTTELATRSIEHLRRFTNKPITWLIITHPNPDKYNGAAVFRNQGAKILSSQAVANAIPGTHAYKEYFFVEMAKMFKKGEYPQPSPVDQTFEGTKELILQGGERIELKELAQPGVSSSQTVAYIRSANSLVVGDLIHHKAHAWLEGGIVSGTPAPTIGGWIADLNELASLFPQDATVYGGRGLTASLGDSVPEQIRYLQTAQSLIRNELRSLGARAQEYTGPNAGALYKTLASTFQAQFPEYELAYLIEYGSYGLVQAELQSLK